MRHAFRATALALVPLAALLAGCGKSGKKAEGPPAFRGVYTTSSDCADSGKITIEQCMEAMQKAVAEHEKTAPKYSSLRSCEATEGPGRCERTESSGFRPILLAILVTGSTPPEGKPLYAATEKKVIGFRSATKEHYLADNEAIPFSEHAQTLAEAHIETKSKAKPKMGGS